jgi:molybdopterin-guanine dinucleotide biosynthesis protein MobB
MPNVSVDPSLTDLPDNPLTLERTALLALVDAVAQRLAPPVVSFVAKSGTGKTTFLEKLLPELKARGLRVGVLKHHGHPTSFDAPGKDTDRLAQAGADVVIGVSAVQVAVFRQEDGAADLDAVIARHAAGLDLLLTEGYKRGPYPKIEINRAGRSMALLCPADELLALVSDMLWPLPTPQFDLDDAAGVADFLVQWLASGGAR